MSTSDERATDLTPREHQLFLAWTKEVGQKSLAAEFNVDLRTIRRWKKSRRVGHSKFEAVREALRQRTLKIETGDPAQEIRGLFDEARRLHYGCFLPEAAMDVLGEVVFHQAIQAVPPAEMLNMLAVTMAIYRQSFEAADGHFQSCGRRCLRLLSSLRLSEYGDDLAAAICTVAWELVAATVQRGWAMDGVPLLERINGILDERRLWRHLQIGREQSIRRLMHWGRVIAYDRLDEVRVYLGKHASPIDELSPTSPYGQVEIPNIVSQKMWEFLRFSMATGQRKAKDRASNHFESRIRPLLLDLERSSRDLSVPAAQASPMRESYTPSTALAIAFQSYVVAHHLLGPRDASDVIECATQITQRIRRVSDGAIMLQKINPETQTLIRATAALGKLHSGALEMCAFVTDISERGKMKLHALAQHLLDCVARCRRG
jgi:hypothetical protein